MNEIRKLPQLSMEGFATKPRIRGQLIVLLAAIAVLALAACSGSDDLASATDAESTTPETATPAPASPQGAGGFGGGRTQLDQGQITALAACLQGRGFEVPDDATNLQALFGDGPPSVELQEALSECGTEVGVTLPGGFDGGGGAFGGGRTQLDQEQVAALAACLEGRGFEVPDGATSLQALFGDGPPSVELQDALSECGTEVGVTLPGGFGGDGGGFGGRGQ